MNPCRLLVVAAAAASFVACGSSDGTGTGGTSPPPSIAGTGASGGGGQVSTGKASGSAGTTGATATSNTGGTSAAASTAPSNQPGASTGAGGQGSSTQPPAGSMGTSAPPASTSAPASTAAANMTGAPPPNDPNTVTLTMGDFTVQPGDEVFMCQDFQNPFGGQDAAIGRSESDMTPGSHHLHVFYGADSPPSYSIQSCANPYEFRSLLHVGGLPTVVTQYPAGMAAKLKGSLGLRLQVHYLNATANALPGHVVVKLTKVDPSTVQNWVAELYFNRVQLSVPVGDGMQVQTTCTVPGDFGPIGLLSGQTHMHKQGVHFVASTSTGVSLADTMTWNDPPIVPYNPPIMLNPGDSITWTCTYNNDTGQTLVFGDSAQTNEMCIFLARYYSSPDGNDIECQSPSDSSAGVVTQNVAGQ